MKKKINAEQTWKHKFLIMTVGQAFSIIGSSAVQFALVWWLASETSSPMLLSFSKLLVFLPQLFLGPFVGVWIDRLKRKTVIICADLFSGMVATAFAVSFLFGKPPFWSVCIVLGIRAIGGVFQTPAIQSAIPMLVPKQELVRANGWSQFMQSGSLMLGPVIGAVMYAVLPMPIILLSDLIGALAASVAIAGVKIPELRHGDQQRPAFAKEIKEGISIFVQDKRLGIVTFAAAICMGFYVPLSSFYPLMTSDYFHLTAWYASIVQFGSAGGMMLCAVLAGVYGKIKNKLLGVHIGLLGIGLGAFFCGILPSSFMAFWVFSILCTLIGFSGNLYNIPYAAYMQETVPHEMQGRAFSTMNSLMSLTMPIGLVIAGPVAEILGVKSWFFISGLAFIIITSISYMLVYLQSKPSKKDNKLN